ncbi:Chymotrypsin-like elastase family member 2A [Papilio xuthus]|uniref:Chymotrypsin-like elastase family member 2A n=1 Tax=Papilio xuthus TaxID=66420 RepID=A0A194QET1_PAPXU|nr:Chymotrypsin-like elastase family member 2A [Papilio xuthus]
MKILIIKTILFYYSTLLFGVHCEDGWALVGNPLLHAYPCNNVTDITISFEPGRPPGEENQYNVFIGKSVPRYTKIKLKFDTEAVVTLFDSAKARISVENDNEFTIHFFDNADSVGFTVRGPVTGTVPYFESLNINTVEYCKSPNKGYLDSLIIGTKVSAESHLKVPDGSCGRRKVEHTELIVNGADTKPGDWPWHTALYRVKRNLIKYICGGTLLSKTFVLTAAHCTSVRGQPVVPETLNVVLGKYNIAGGDLEAQEKTVQEIIVHDNFDAKQLHNDIALLKLTSEVLFNDYVQPACLWFPTAVEKLTNKEKIIGTVVGWGFDQDNALSTQLRQATMPQISDSDCIKKNPLFYSKLLNNKKFCAGFGNGTSACNGDSGGGFHVFIPDVTGSDFANATGAWYVYGIVSLSVSRRDMPVCDPNQYVVFTKIAEYRGWIQKYVK